MIPFGKEHIAHVHANSAGDGYVQLNASAVEDIVAELGLSKENAAGVKDHLQSWHNATHGSTTTKVGSGTTSGRRRMQQKPAGSGLTIPLVFHLMSHAIPAADGKP